MKNALITAASKGIGKAVAKAFALEGINLAVCSRNEAELVELKAELLAINPNIQVYIKVVDCGIKEELIAFAQYAEEALGSIAVIVNNVGMYSMNSILDDTQNDFDAQINTNLRPAYELYRFFGKKMKDAKSGHIFNICSVASVNPIAAAGTYSVTKYALLGLNKVMRQEMEPYGVKVTAIIPGSTLTDSWRGVEVDKDKMVLPEDVAIAIITAFKMSPGANVDEITIKPVYGQL
jgi:short-subunit dehydrogenase